MEIAALREEQRGLVEAGEELRQSRGCLEQEVRGGRAQLEYAQEELYRQKAAFAGRLLEKEAEVDRLRAQVGTGVRICDGF